MKTIKGKLTLSPNVLLSEYKNKYVSIFIYSPGICGADRLYKTKVLGIAGKSYSYSFSLDKNSYKIEGCLTDKKGNKVAEGCICSDLYKFYLNANMKYDILVKDHCSAD